MISTRREFVVGSIAFIGSVQVGLAQGPVNADQVSQACLVRIPTTDQIPTIYLDNPSLLGLRANSLLDQLSRGYEFFGSPKRWVTSLSYDSLSTSINNHLREHREIAKGLNDLACASDALLAQEKTYDDGIAKVSAAQVLIVQNTDKLSLDATELRLRIEALSGDLSTQKGQIDYWQASFNQAVLNAQGDRCDFGTVLRIAGVVIAVVGAIYTGGTSLVAVYSSLDSFATDPSVGAEALGLFARLKSDYESAKPIVTKVETAIASTDDIGKKFDDLKTTLTNNPNSGRLLIDQKSWDQLSKKRIDDLNGRVDGTAGVPPGIKQAFKESVQKYYDLCQVNNQMISAHDSLILQVKENATKLLELSVGSRDLSELKTRHQQSSQSTFKSQYVSTLMQIQRAQLSVMRRFVWDAKRAQAFMQVDPDLLAQDVMLKLNNLDDPIALSQFNLTLDERQIAYHEELAKNPSNPFNSPVIFQLDIHEGPRRELVSSKRLLFSITPLHNPYKASWREVFLTHVKVSMEPNGSQFSGILVNLGSHGFVDIRGNAVSFESDDLRVSVAGDMSNPEPLIGTTSSAQGAGVGGFGNWMLIADDDVPGTFLEGLQSVSLQFQGRNRTKSI